MGDDRHNLLTMMTPPDLDSLVFASISVAPRDLVGQESWKTQAREDVPVAPLDLLGPEPVQALAQDGVPHLIYMLEDDVSVSLFDQGWASPPTPELPGSLGNPKHGDQRFAEVVETHPTAAHRAPP